MERAVLSQEVPPAVLTAGVSRLGRAGWRGLVQLRLTFCSFTGHCQVVFAKDPLIQTGERGVLGQVLPYPCPALSLSSCIILQNCIVWLGAISLSGKLGCSKVL